jgi:hypothetical protein
MESKKVHVPSLLVVIIINDLEYEVARAGSFGKLGTEYAKIPYEYKLL